MNRIIRIAVALLLVASLLCAVPVAADNSTVTVSLRGDVHYDVANEVLQLVNTARTARGLSPLVMNAHLLEAAVQRAAEIAVSFSHTRPDGQSCFTAIDGEFWSLGENIAWGYHTAAEVMDGWMHSEGHRANILNAHFDSIGVGVFFSNGQLCWVQMLGAHGVHGTVDKRGSESAVISFPVLKDSLTLERPFADYTVDLRHGFAPVVYGNEVLLDSSCLTVTVKNGAIAKVKDGYVIPLAEGKTEVTVALGDVFSATVPLVVTASDCGDMNGDGTVDSTDARLILQLAVGKLSYDDLSHPLRGDVNEDGRIDSTDARLALQYAVEKIPCFTRDYTLWL